MKCSFRSSIISLTDFFNMLVPNWWKLSYRLPSTTQYRGICLIPPRFNLIGRFVTGQILCVINWPSMSKLYSEQFNHFQIPVTGFLSLLRSWKRYLPAFSFKCSGKVPDCFTDKEHFLIGNSLAKLRINSYIWKLTKSIRDKPLLNATCPIVSAFYGVGNGRCCFWFSRAHGALHEGFCDHGFCFVIVKLDVPDGIFLG